MANSKSNRTFINLDSFGGTGEVGRYRDEVIGILLGIEPREGTYQVVDRRTGQTITRPNSWTAVFEDGSMWSWPTYIDENGEVKPWSRFDQSIKLGQVVKNKQRIHVWKDQKGFAHLELVREQEVATNPLPAACPFDVE